MRYIATAKYLSQVDGRTFATGEPVATITIDTDVPKHQIVQMLHACDINIADYQPAPPSPVAVAPKVATVVQPVESPKPTEPIAPVVTIDISGFPGLDKKLAEKLVIGKIVNADDKSVRFEPIMNDDQLAEKIDAGFDLIEIDGIGKLAKAKIEKWLDDQGNKQVDEDEEESAEGE